MADQLGFDLPSRAAMGRADFFVSPSNAMAVALIDAWPDWPSGKIAIIGPQGAGKTHLAHVWAASSGARIVAAGDLDGADIAAIAAAPVAVEDVQTIAGRPASETALFHLHNLVLAEGHSLLLTSDAPASALPFALPDLRSRLQGTSTARLDPPDDALLMALLVKLFADRQINPKPALIPWLARRMDRSFATAQDTVERLDDAGLARKKPIGIALAREVLGW